MSLAIVRAYVATELETISGIQTAFSDSGGRPLERAPLDNELPACLLFRGPSTYNRRNTGSSGAHRVVWELRIELLVSRKGPGIESAIDTLEPFFDSVPLHFEQNIKLGGNVLTSRILSDNGEIGITYGGEAFLGTHFIMQIEEDKILSRE